MSIQAQSQVQPVTPVERTTKPAAEYTDASAQETAKMVDTSIGVVESAQQKGDSTDGQDSGSNGQSANNEQLKKAVETFNKQMGNSEAVFGIHEGTNRITIKLVDKTTKKVIKELPPEKTLDMIAKVWEMAGILVDEKR